MVEQLGKLVRVNPREVWTKEASNFTPWLRDNIDYLAEAVGIEIQLVEAEVAVGDFTVDLLGEEPGQSRPVIIENQLERTNHAHLGQLLTYAAGKDGGVIIWVSPEIRPEHRKALEWLNEATRGNLDFFGVELEVLQIEGSALKAPSFKVVVGPKEEPVKLTPHAGCGKNPSEKGIRYQAYFQSLLDEIKKQQPDVTGRKKFNGSWLGLAAGRSGFRFALAFASNERFRIETYIDTGDKLRNKTAFDLLEAMKEEIQQKLGNELEWDRLNNRKGSRISWYYGQKANVMNNEKSLTELRAWTVPNFFKFREVMRPYIQGLDIDSDSEYYEETGEEE